MSVNELGGALYGVFELMVFDQLHTFEFAGHWSGMSNAGRRSGGAV